MSVHSGLSGNQDAVERRPLAPLPGRARTRSMGLLIVLAVLAVWLSAHLLDFARIALWNRRAPLVVEIRGFSCSLSLDGRYLSVLADSVRRGEDFFDAATGELIRIPRPASIGPASEVYGLWLEEDVYFNYHRWSDDRAIGQQYKTKTTLDDIPEDGWLVDVGSRTATALSQLDTAERERVLTFAREQIRTYDERSEAALWSPNGAYVFRNGAIWDKAGNKVAETYLPDIARPCAFGWKPDSSGIYFVDRERPPASDIAGAAGSIRFLPVP